MIVLEWLFVLTLFFVGVWLSAFFSGSETAYYRLSILRVNVEAQSGSKPAAKILWFIRHPGEFVATVLIGNNVANYVTTLAIGIGLALVTTEPSDAVEIAMTLAAAPVIFLFGELVPKHVNYITPMRSMLKRIKLFRIIYWLLRPLSIPLVWLTRLLEKFGSRDNQTTTAVLGRPQIRELLRQGHLQGVFTDRQAELTNRLLRMGTRSINTQIRPMAFVYGLPETATREEAIANAHSFGLNHTPLHKPDDPTAWTMSVRTADLLTSTLAPRELARPIAVLESSMSRLEAIQEIRASGSGYGIVVDAGKTMGFVSLQALVRPLFQDAPAIAISESQQPSASGR